MAVAWTVRDIRFDDSRADTARISDILGSMGKENMPVAGDRMASIGRMFVGTPYVAHTLENPDGDERLTINTGHLDCTTFVENVLALTMTTASRGNSWRDFARNLESVRYRRGKLDGYASRLHYIAEWIADNASRGNLKDVTPSFPRVKYVEKTIDYMTRHREAYAALKDNDSLYNRMCEVEAGLKMHRYPYIPTAALSDKAVQATFRDGDMVALCTGMRDLDVTHMGLIVKVDGVPHLLHASSSLGQVTVTTEPLSRFMERNRKLTGVRVLRAE